MSIFRTIYEKFKLIITGRWGLDEDDESNFFSRQKVLGFLFAMLLSVSLWIVVNMGRDFNVNMMVPIQIINIPEDVAISSEVPEFAAISLSGEGWSLFNLYTNPPLIIVNAENQQVNMFEQVRQQISSLSDASVMQVDPMFIEIETEQRITRTVPVESRINLSTRDQYGVLGTPRFSPDSVTVTGPASRIEQLEAWHTIETDIQDVNTDVELTVELETTGRGMSVEPSRVLFRADVVEFTEAQVRIPVRARNIPSGEAITFSPSSILVRYDVPIEQYTDVQSVRPFIAYVDYERIREDTTGLITPELENITDDYDVRLRSFQPTRVSYFNIVND